jgi:hypothetical protein
MNTRIKSSVSSTPSNGKPEIRDPLIASYDRLNELWKKAEEDLAAMRLPINVEKRIEWGHSGDGQWEIETCLAWHKLQNQWRICVIRRELDTIGEADGHFSDCKPIMECAMDERINFAPHFAMLKRQMRQARENYIPQVHEAITALEAGLAE